MKLLLDTHIFLWFLNGDRQLSTQFRDRIQDQNNDVYQDQSGVSLGSRSKPLRVRVHTCQQAYSINKVLTAA